MLKQLLTGLFIVTALSANAQVKNLSNDQLKKMIKQGIPVIDIRRPDEWQQTGIIQGSHMLTFFDKSGYYNMDKWMNALNKIAGPEDPFILICRTGSRTGRISQFLDKKLKYRQVSHVSQGINRWISAGEPTVHPN